MARVTPVHSQMTRKKVSTPKARSKKIVVISRDYDPHIKYVQDHLAQPLYCIDSSKIIKHTELTYISQDDSIIFGEDNLSDTGAVWYRKPLPIRELELPVKEEYKLYVEDSLNRLASGLRASFQDAFWLSDYYAIAKAENKSWQMKMARRLGFSIPDTIITSSPERAAEFIDAHENVIVKSLASMGPIVGKTTYLATMRFKREEKHLLKGLHLAPAIFQEEIDVAAELRVTVVGDRVFSAITQDKGVDGMEYVRDWRISQLVGELHFAAHELSGSVAKKCVELVKGMGLEFGAIDFILDKNNKLWFLEINPNGQWAFIEDDTTQPIGKTIAEYLEKRSNSQ